MDPLERAALALETADLSVPNTTNDLDATIEAWMMQQQILDRAATDQNKRMVDESASGTGFERNALCQEC
jgi:hypothetical protein